MDTVVLNHDSEISREGTGSQAQEIYQECVSHPAIAALGAFNGHCASRALTLDERRLFFASMAAFNRHTVGGIAILAGRVSDELLGLLPRSAHEIAALILDAAVDEYGLRESVTHVELARRFAEHLGISADEVEARENAGAEAGALGEALYGWYRTMPTAFCLGVHTASEVTSVKEFMAWHDVFLNFPQYRLSLDQPEFEYMRAHYVAEPNHVRNVSVCVGRYLDVLPSQGRLLREGAQTYLNCYQRMFEELDSLIFR